MTYGLYLSLALIVLSLLFYIAELYMEDWTSYISYAVLFAGVGFSSFLYRNNHLNGFISYGDSMLTGFLTGLFAAVITSIYTYIFMTYLGTDMITEMLIVAEESVLSGNPDISDEDLEMAMSITRKVMQPGGMSLMALLFTSFFAVVFSLVTSIFIKKEEIQE